MSNITVEKVSHPFKSTLKWKVVIGENCFPLRPSIFCHCATKKQALDLAKGLELIVDRINKTGIIS